MGRKSGVNPLLGLTMGHETIVAELRRAAVGLEDSANRLEELDLYEQADQLRTMAQRLRVDAAFGVVGQLLVAPAGGLPDGVLHGRRDRVGVHVHLAGAPGRHSGDDVVDTGQLGADQGETLLLAVVVVRRRRHRLVAVHVLERELGVRLADAAPVWYRDSDGRIQSVDRVEFRKLAKSGTVGPEVHGISSFQSPLRFQSNQTLT